VTGVAEFSRAGIVAYTVWEARRFDGPGPLAQVVVDCRLGAARSVAPQLREAPVFSERTSVGLDVHARSIVGCGLDSVTGEVFRRRLTPTFAGVSSWLAELPAPVAVTYEAGPTGFGLARELTGAGVRCLVAAPSKLQRPPGDRVKTDARDALHLARLLRMDQIVPVRVPSVEQEAARDLVRAREDVRSDLMRGRHRLSKLLLRQGIIYSGGKPWTGAHEHWLRGQHFDLPGLQTAFDSAFETVVLTQGRRDRLGLQERRGPTGRPVRPDRRERQERKGPPARAEHVGRPLRDMVVADFSTTTLFHRAATEVALMDAFQGYFEYEMLAGCGIPAINLMGAPDDWRDVRRRAAAFGKYGLDRWMQALLPVLDQIEATSRGHGDREFWQSFFRYRSGSLGSAMTGWIHVLFPYLKDVSGNSVLPIWVGIYEANAIALEIEKVTTQRPMTHDLIKSLLLGLNTGIKKVVVNELREDTFYALIWLERDGELISVDSRPSDALALALRLDCPIFVDDTVLKSSKLTANVSDKVNNEELRKWLEGLNDEDLGRYKM